MIFASSLAPSSERESLSLSPSKNGVVEKAPLEEFSVQITFKNIGATSGTWSVNIAFEADTWIWKGTSQSLVLEPNNKRVLVWNGFVPKNATPGSTSRLMVYYNDSYVALGWWIYVVSNAELSIESSNVK